MPDVYTMPLCVIASNPISITSDVITIWCDVEVIDFVTTTGGVKTGSEVLNEYTNP